MSDVRWLSEREERVWRALQFMQMRLEAEIVRQLAVGRRRRVPCATGDLSVTLNDDSHSQLPPPRALRPFRRGEGTRGLQRRSQRLLRRICR